MLGSGVRVSYAPPAPEPLIDKGSGFLLHIYVGGFKEPATNKAGNSYYFGVFYSLLFFFAHFRPDLSPFWKRLQEGVGLYSKGPKWSAYIKTFRPAVYKP